jgi:hypothetical protein
MRDRVLNLRYPLDLAPIELDHVIKGRAFERYLLQQKRIRGRRTAGAKEEFVVLLVRPRARKITPRFLIDIGDVKAENLFVEAHHDIDVLYVESHVANTVDRRHSVSSFLSDG